MYKYKYYVTLKFQQWIDLEIVLKMADYSQARQSVLVDYNLALSPSPLLVSY